MSRISIKGEIYKEVVLRVRSRNILGNPGELSVIEDDQIVDLEELSKEGTVSFIIAWIKESNFKNEL